ncbi:MAG: fatty acyl-AMP ligase [Robiginitomaculum sp.]
MTSATDTKRGQKLIHGHFETLIDGLEYAATCNTGFNFYSGRGDLVEKLSYKDLCERAKEMALRLVGMGEVGDRIGLLAVTNADFAILFFACQYAGLIPAPLPLPVTLGGRGSYERQLQRMTDTGDFKALFCPSSMENIISSALNDYNVPVISFEDVQKFPKKSEMRPHQADGPCYIQYSSGSSSSPKGIIGTQSTVTSNCIGILGPIGMNLREDDRATSWLPLYHDMGLIGFMIAPLMGQLSVDYLSSSDFTRRPVTWLHLISDMRGTISYSPTFGYELCVRRWREDRELDLSSWRAAGIGGDMVQPEPLKRFAKTFAASGFESKAFTPSYGLAETTLGATFAPQGQGLLCDTIDMVRYERTGAAVPATDLTPSEHKRTFVACGKIIPDHKLEIRDMDTGKALCERKVGRICLCGPSITPGYFRNALATKAAFTSDGWLDTGDLGYWLDEQLVVTGRFKDLILFHGRNIWPQDIEWAAQAAAPSRCGRACSFSIGKSGDEKDIILLLECRTRDEKLLEEIFVTVSSAIRLEIGAPVRLILVPRGTMIITSSGKLSRVRVREKMLEGAIIDLQAEEPIRLVEASGNA